MSRKTVEKKEKPLEEAQKDLISTNDKEIKQTITQQNNRENQSKLNNIKTSNDNLSNIIIKNDEKENDTVKKPIYLYKIKEQKNAQNYSASKDPNKYIKGNNINIMTKINLSKRETKSINN